MDEEIYDVSFKLNGENRCDEIRLFPKQANIEDGERIGSVEDCLRKKYPNDRIDDIKVYKTLKK